MIVCMQWVWLIDYKNVIRLSCQPRNVQNFNFFHEFRKNKGMSSYMTYPNFCVFIFRWKPTQFDYKWCHWSQIQIKTRCSRQKWYIIVLWDNLSYVLYHITVMCCIFLCVHLKQMQWRLKFAIVRDFQLKRH